jgi:2-methylisocitrate lyase-like PEP mutase family enzyme
VTPLDRPVPTVPHATRGVAWLRSHVARFSNGDDHVRRRALAVGLLDRIDPEALRRAESRDGGDPVSLLATALGVSAHPRDVVLRGSGGRADGRPRRPDRPAVRRGGARVPRPRPRDHRRSAGEDGVTFHDLHDGPEPLLLPNAWDFSSAAALVAAGFPAVGTTSLGVAAACGLPDAEGLTREATVALAARLVRLPVPISVDVEAGFGGDPHEVAALAAELAGLGVAGINLEDGRPGGVLADADAQCALIRAVKHRVPGLFVNARTDTHWVDPGASADEAVRRVVAYADAGADGVFVPGLAEPDDVRAVVGAVPVAVNLLHLPGRTTVAGLAALGVRRISTGSLLFRAALRATAAAALAVRDGTPLPAGLPTYREVDDLSRGHDLRRGRRPEE